MRSEFTPIPLIGATRLVAAAILTSIFTYRTEDLWVLKICIKYSSGDAREQRAFELIGRRAATTTEGRA